MKKQLSINQTQKAIVAIKNHFQANLAHELNLYRVSAPLFVDQQLGINDQLDHKQAPVSFYVPKLNKTLEIVQSLAKWKRLALVKYEFETYEGLYTDMNAIRAHDDVDSKHSIYVDQWDWELLINDTDRNLAFLFSIVKKIYQALKSTYLAIKLQFNLDYDLLNEDIVFISSQELEDLYPHLDPDQREYEFAKIHKAIFIYQVGYPLKSNLIQSSRSPEYDDWLLNGDLVVYHPINDFALELSSMGIRVNKESFIKQTKFANIDPNTHSDLYYDLMLNDQLPSTIGGGIGQSRLCMFLLQCEHIGQVQVSVWDDDTINQSKKQKIYLL
ncbi:aspartate--ammonia ligase [Ureaplasma diversum]|uniref:Aspartate-ammonia ligase n=1 Tax=Ureaplasma diversum NCTC 246 TaxID=1188241 RepID=A0A084F058_9BACT|nr:aspartate--ammonia ligase [Ureaplasma diversum]KEZ23600.1 Aspartate-ammonia ligase [Ureaplasma diversum NCTC 246]